MWGNEKQFSANQSVILRNHLIYKTQIMMIMMIIQLREFILKVGSKK